MNQIISILACSFMLIATPFFHQKPRIQASQEKVLHFGYVEQDKIVSIRYVDPDYAIFVSISTIQGKDEDGFEIIIRDDKIRTVLGSQENPYREYEYINKDGTWLRIEHSSNTLCVINQEYLEKQYVKETHKVMELCIALKNYVAQKGSQSGRLQILELVKPIASHYGK